MILVIKNVAVIDLSNDQNHVHFYEKLLAYKFIYQENIGYCRG